MADAIERDGAAQRALLDGDPTAARESFLAAASCYRRSWEAAPPASYGRLVGMLKSSVLAGEGRDAAAYVRAAIDSDDESSPVAAYALSIAALVLGDDAEAARLAPVMGSGPSEAFARTADAVAALARGDDEAYVAALESIVSDFEARPEHLTGVVIADTAAMLEALAAPRGMRSGVRSAVLPGG